MAEISTVEELEALYGIAKGGAIYKEVDFITPEYKALIEAAPFMALATSGPEGLDCSPRGDPPGFVHVHDNKTLMVPDRPGNNRLDSLRNIVSNPIVGLLFLIPGLGITMRVNGKAKITTDRDLLEKFAIKTKLPRSVLVIKADAVYFQCSQAIQRGQLWNPESHVEPSSLPTGGRILASMSNNSLDGKKWDRQWAARPRDALYAVDDD